MSERAKFIISCQCTLSVELSSLGHVRGTEFIGTVALGLVKQDHQFGEGTQVLFRSLGNDPRTDFATGSVFVPMGFVLSWSHRLLLFVSGSLTQTRPPSHTRLEKGVGYGCWACGIAHLRASALHQAESTLRECVILHPSLANVQAGKNSVHRLP